MNNTFLLYALPILNCALSVFLGRSYRRFLPFPKTLALFVPIMALEMSLAPKDAKQNKSDYLSLSLKVQQTKKFLLKILLVKYMP